MSAAVYGQHLPVLLVDDEHQTLQSYELLLRAGGIERVLQCDDSREVLSRLAQQEVGLILLDLFMPHLSGEKLLPRLLELHPEIPIIILTGANSVEIAVRCMHMGVLDYMVKPVEESRLLGGVRRALELRELRRENIRLSQRMLSDQLEHPDAFESVATRNGAMRAIFKYAEAIAASAMPVLITGETGVGKELLARILHHLSGREGAFVPVNIAGLDDQLFSDTLFGHERGAFTGADATRAGIIEQAQGGTLFLDEIGDLSPASQVKLLRVLQEREYLRVGSDVPRVTDARILAATNRGKDELLDSGDFRKDLFFRLQTHHIHIPPLRERLDDLPLLTAQFLEEAAERLKKKTPAQPPQLFELLAAYHFPGNVRELQGMIHDAVSRHSSGALSLDAFRLRISERQQIDPHQSPLQAAEDGLSPFTSCAALPTLKEANQMLMQEAMRRAGGNQTVAARLLGISQSALSRRLKQHE